uniref:Uncharacterized protein n=1 Tax=Anguilla anguilla TaxID=7936 RepID=A0A0E9QCR4_ANGAN
MDFRHFRCKHSSGFFKIRIIAGVSFHSEQPVLGCLVHIEIFNKFTRLQSQIVVFIHF